MNTRKEVLAQAASVRLIAAACAGLGKMWNRQEELHAAATSRATSWAAAEPLLELCGGCPIVAECRTWAGVDDYTGIAAGSAWVKGVEKPAVWIHRHPVKKIAS